MIFKNPVDSARYFSRLHRRFVESVYVRNRRFRILTDRELKELRHFLFTIDCFVSMDRQGISETYRADAMNITRELREREKATKAPKKIVLRKFPNAYCDYIHDCLYHIRRGENRRYSGPLAWGDNPRQAWQKAAEKVKKIQKKA